MKRHNVVDIRHRHNGGHFWGVICLLRNWWDPGIQAENRSKNFRQTNVNEIEPQKKMKLILALSVALLILSLRLSRCFILLRESTDLDSDIVVNGTKIILG